MPIGDGTAAPARTRADAGKALPHGCVRARVQRGVTYLLLLFALAIIGATLATAGTAWATAAQRGAEAELLFRGVSIRRAILSYARSTPDGSPRLPATFAELIEDRRGLVPRHHLRQLYTDPFTGRADWVAVLDNGRIRGVHSRSDRAALRSVLGTSGGVAGKVSEWVFAVTAEEVAPAAVPDAAAAASAGSAPAPAASSPSATQGAAQEPGP